MASRLSSALLVQRDLRLSRVWADDLTLAYDILLGILTPTPRQADFSHLSALPLSDKTSFALPKADLACSP